MHLQCDVRGHDEFLLVASLFCSCYSKTDSRRGRQSSRIHAPMSSHHHHRRGNPVLPVSFFKIILQTNLARLKIPNKFTRRYGGALSNPVLLKPPDGTQWKVNWSKQNGHEVWFEKGWTEFTQNYSLDHGHLVLFKYNGTSQFDVFIFDQSCLEKDYPLRKNCDDDVEKGILDDEGKDESVQVLKEIPPQKKAKRKMTSVSTQPLKKERGKKVTQNNASSLNWPKGPRAQEIAQNFSSKNPFFTFFFKPVHLIDYKVCIPSLEGYIENEEKNVMLQVEGKSWYVKLRRCHFPNARCFSAGWSLFVQDNGFQAGDICIFELVNLKDFVFKVHVFKRQT